LISLPPPPEIPPRPTFALVDLAAIRHNVRAVRSLAGKARIMGIVKANAYGHGLVTIARQLLAEGVDELGVGFLEEGVELRRAGIRVPILVLGGIFEDQIPWFLRYGLDLAASSVFKIDQIERAAEACGVRARVHLKIDTGMGRIGVQWDTAHQLFERAVKASHLQICGVFSHLATADSDDPTLTHEQIDRFDRALEFFPSHGLPMPTRHLAASGGILQHPRAIYEMVRPGIMLYGLYPGRGVLRTVPLRPALTLETRVVYFKVGRRGRRVSYNGVPLERDTRVVTLPLGYGDGYPRSLSRKGHVLIGGRRFPILGNVTMDAVMVDVQDASVFNGERAVLLGSQGSEAISAEELADRTGTIPYEILSSINTRVPRIYVDSDASPA